MATRRTNGLSYWPIRIMWVLEALALRRKGSDKPGKAPRGARRAPNRTAEAGPWHRRPVGPSSPPDADAMLHTHHLVYVLLSLTVAVLGSWTALDLFRRVRTHVGRAQRTWLATAAVAM